MKTTAYNARLLGAALIVATSLSILAISTAPRAEEVAPDEAHAIAVDAYAYFYPLVTMDVTRRQLTNIEAGRSEIGGPMNMFVNVQAFPSADMRAVVRPNFDTLYSSGWLDLTHGPIVVSAPDTGGRYYLLPMLDMWTDVFASPGSRNHGDESREFPDCATRLEVRWTASQRRPADRRTDTLRMGDRPHENGWSGRL